MKGNKIEVEKIGRPSKQGVIGKMADNVSKTSGLYVLYRNSLMAKGLENLLKNDGMPVIAIDMKEDGAWERLNEGLRPGDVVIVDKRDLQVHPSLSIMKLFMNNAEITIIGVDPCENSLELYKRQAQVIKEPEELVKTIGGCWPNLQRVNG